MIRAVLFDFGQTLVDSAAGFRTAEREAQRKIFASLKHVAEAQFLEVYRGVRKARHERSLMSRVGIWQEVCARLGQVLDVHQLHEWETHYWQRVNELSRILPDAVETLRDLSAHYRLAMISNTQGQTLAGEHRLSAFPELGGLFEVIVISGERGIPAKPHREPFARCVKALALDASECIYVGDDYRIDICGARDAGLHPIWLKHQAVKRNWPDIETDVPVITSLNALTEDVGSLVSPGSPNSSPAPGCGRVSA